MLHESTKVSQAMHMVSDLLLNAVLMMQSGRDSHCLLVSCGALAYSASAGDGAGLTPAFVQLA